MFAVLSKTLTPLISPLGLSCLLWIAAAVLYWRQRVAWSMRCGVAGIAVVVSCSNPIIADAMLGSLENDHSAKPVSEYDEAEAIVVLGGVTGAKIPPRQSADVNSGFDRLLEGMRLYKAGKAPILVVSGGTIPSLTGSEITEGERLRDLVREYGGIDQQQLLVESKSRNTFENAVYVKQRLDKHAASRILLVTSASHMWRAVGCFEKQGFAVTPAPADIEVVPRPFGLQRILPSAEAMKYSSRAVKEYVGWVVYWIRGWL